MVLLYDQTCIHAHDIVINVLYYVLSQEQIVDSTPLDNVPSEWHEWANDSNFIDTYRQKLLYSKQNKKELNLEDLAKTVGKSVRFCVWYYYQKAKDAAYDGKFMHDSLFLLPRIDAHIVLLRLPYCIDFGSSAVDPPQRYTLRKREKKAKDVSSPTKATHKSTRSSGGTKGGGNDEGANGEGDEKEEDEEEEEVTAAATQSKKGTRRSKRIDRQSRSSSESNEEELMALVDRLEEENDRLQLELIRMEGECPTVKSLTTIMWKGQLYAAVQVRPCQSIQIAGHTYRPAKSTSTRNRPELSSPSPFVDDNQDLVTIQFLRGDEDEDASVGDDRVATRTIPNHVLEDAGFEIHRRGKKYSFRSALYIGYHQSSSHFKVGITVKDNRGMTNRMCGLHTSHLGGFWINAESAGHVQPKVLRAFEAYLHFICFLTATKVDGECFTTTADTAFKLLGYFKEYKKSKIVVVAVNDRSISFDGLESNLETDRKKHPQWDNFSKAYYPSPKDGLFDEEEEGM